MSSFTRTVILAFLLVCAGLLILSCNRDGDPVTPDTLNQYDSHGGSGSADIPMTEPSDGFDTPPGYPHSSDEPDYAPDQVLVKLADGYVPMESDGNLLPGSQMQVEEFFQQHNLEIMKIIPADWGTVFKLHITDGTDVFSKVDELNSLPEIDTAEVNYKVYFTDTPYVPNDPLWENPSDTDDDPRTTVFEQFGPSKIGASYVWDVTTGDGIVVCVIDTGIQVWHEDLQANMWINEDEIPDNDTDDDDNGYIDDIYGWDTDSNDADIVDYGGGSYHGTGCSGVVAATRDNNLGCSGIAPDARLMGIRIGFNSGFYDAVIEGVNYANDNDADVVSMSFITTNNSGLMHDAMDAAWEAGVILVAGAGNDEGTWVYYPCTWDSVIKVGATSPFSQNWAYDPIDEVRISIAAGFGWGSTYGNGQEIMAFGEHYISTFGGGADEYWDGHDNFFFGGTSNATPMIAASFALLKQYFPGETQEWYRERLRATSDDVNVYGYDDETGHGRVNMIRAIYGTDRYALEEDVDGFVDIGTHSENLITDSLNGKDFGDYIDMEDLYKFTASEEGYLLFDLNIFTWGKDFELEMYSDPALDPLNLVDSSTGENHAWSSHELVGTYAYPGETFYVKVYPAGLGDCSAYDLSARIVQNSISLETADNDPGFIHSSGNNKYAGSLDFEVGYRVNISELIFSHRGSMPADKLVALHIFRDSNQSRDFDGPDTLVGTGVFDLTNRAIVPLDEEIDLTESPQMFFVTFDVNEITEDAEFELVLTNYKDVSTTEGIEVAYDTFPCVFGPFQVGIDSDPPSWDSTIGAVTAIPKYNAAVVYWNGATDVLTPPVDYNVYWTDTLPFDFGTANHQDDVNTSGGGSYDYRYQISGLVNNQEFYIAVRAEDQAGNEDSNTEYVMVTPSAISDPTAPQVIGSLNTPGNAWEVVCDAPNQRLFVADYNSLLEVDVSDPTNPTFVDSVSGSEVSGVEYDGTYVYGAASNGLMIVNPDSVDGLELVNLVPASDALDVAISGNWAYVSTSGTTLYTFDITDPMNPVDYPDVSSGQSGYGMDIEGNYLYIATNQKPKVFDISNPSAPSNTGANFGGNYAYEIDAIGDRLYVTYWFNHKVSVYTLSNPSSPSWIGQFVSTGGYNASDIVEYNGYIYFGTNNHHVEVLDVTDASDIDELGQVSTKGPDGLATDGMFVYSAENEHGIKVIL